MHKVHRSYKDMVQRRDWVMLLLEVVVSVVGKSDSGVNKEESATAE
jgi:hypothetical protein